MHAACMLFDAAAPRSMALTLTPSRPARNAPEQGMTGGLGAGMLGYFFGFVPALARYRGRAWGMVHGEGVRSAKQLALMSGLYTAVHCICQRLRLKEDGLNRGVAGCSTGLVLGWAGGPWAAAQSCLGIGAISYFLDFGELAGEGAARGRGAGAVRAPEGGRGRRVGFGGLLQ